MSRARVQTRVVHAGELPERVLGAVGLPIFSAASFEFSGRSPDQELGYIRLNNTPNHKVLNAKLADLEGAEAAMVSASGMAAISTALLSVLRAGDHLLVQESLYGGTHGLVHEDLPRFGIEVSTIDASETAGWNGALRPNTRAIYVEAVSNPLTRIGALDRVPPFAREHGLVSLIDNTFASPVNYRPIEHGFDLILHSVTKYLNGHGDLVAGVTAGSAERIAAFTALLNRLGGSLDPHTCSQVLRGLKTLGLRMRQHDENAERLARFLEDCPAVARVHHPSLTSHPDHERARAWFASCGGVLSFELTGGMEAAQRLLDRLRLPAVAPSLGGPETLVTRPAITSHASLDPELRRGLGIPDSLIRVACGLEEPEDLIADFQQALSEPGRTSGSA